MPGEKDNDRAELLKELETLRRRVRELETNENKYQTLFTKMIDGYALHEIICDEAGNPVDYRFLDLNPAFERLTGIGFHTEGPVGQFALGRCAPLREPS